MRSIAPGSPAEERLISAEDGPTPDIITEVEGRPVRNEAELRTALGNARNGIVTLSVVAGSRDGATTRVVRVRVDK